jgi:predicted molibdopterin-dependent oxidoreductase YjgC
VRITSRRNSIEIAVRLSPRVARHQIFIPMHYREAAANLLTNPALDPYAHIPEFKVCAVRIEPVTPRDRKALTAERIEPLVPAD